MAATSMRKTEVNGGARSIRKARSGHSSPKIRSCRFLEWLLFLFAENRGSTIFTPVQEELREFLTLSEKRIATCSFSSARNGVRVSNEITELQVSDDIAAEDARGG